MPVPVITAGGCGLAQNFDEGYQPGAARTFFCQRDQNTKQCRLLICHAGLPIRLEV